MAILDSKCSLFSIWHSSDWDSAGPNYVRELLFKNYTKGKDGLSVIACRLDHEGADQEQQLAGTLHESCIESESIA